MACGCEEGFEFNPNTGLCESTETVDAIYSGLSYNVEPIIPSNAFGWLGAVFYENIDSLVFPIKTVFGGSVRDDTNYLLNINNTIINDFWGDVQSPDTTNGRLNAAGVWAYTNPPTNTIPVAGIQPLEWIGFTACIEVPETKVYYIGFAADNNIRIRLNNLSNIIFLFNYCNLISHFQKYHVFPITLQQGTNILYVEGSNCASLGGMVVEIYDATYAELAAISNETQIDNHILFSTKNRIGTTYDLGSISGYTCPQGYLLSNCSGELNCQELTSREYEECALYEATNCFQNLTILIYISNPENIISNVQGLGISAGDYVTVLNNINLCINISYSDGQTNIVMQDYTFSPSEMIHNGKPVYIIEIHEGSIDAQHYMLWNETLGRWEIWEDFTEGVGGSCKACCLNGEFGVSAPWFVLESEEPNSTLEVPWEYLAGPECEPIIPLKSVRSSSLCEGQELIQLETFIDCWTLEEREFEILQIQAVEIINNFESCNTCSPGINFQLGTSCNIVDDYEVEDNNTHCDIEKLQDIKCNFSDEIYDKYMSMRYGINTCCETDYDKWDIKNSLLDLELKNEPNHCVEICNTGCPEPCNVDAEIILPNWQSCPQPSNADVNISIE